MKRLFLITGILLIAVSYSAGAATCSLYERQVYDTAQAVAQFRQTQNFTKIYGWSTAGPYHKWLEHIQNINKDEDNARKLLVSHGFTPMEIYSVADEFRTAGRLYDFYKELDSNIKSLQCK